MPTLSLAAKNAFSALVPERSTPVERSTLRQDLQKAGGRAWLLATFFGVQIFLAVVLFALEAPRIEGQVELLLLLLVLDFVAELMPVAMYGNSYTTVGYALTIAVVILFGPAGAVMAGPLEGVAGRLGRGSLDYKAITNGARFVVLNWSAAKAMEYAAGPRPYDIDLWFLICASGVILGYSLVAHVLIAMSASLRHGTPFWTILGQHSWLTPHNAVLGLLGVAIVAGYTALGVIGALVFVTPILMMRLAKQQYTDKTRENIQKLTEQNTTLQKANIEIRKISDELRESYDGTLEALVNALDAREQETMKHSLRVSRYMMDIAKELGVSEGTKDWTDMQRGSLLHDVGKIGVSDGILLKPAKLTPEEWESMRKHPEIGYNMLRQVKFLQGPAEIVLAHHERWDGQGYPRGLHQDEIPLGARIFTVVDTFDSMTSDRPYRKALTAMDALNEILRCNGSQFDPLVVEAFLDVYDKWVREREQLHALTAWKSAA